MNRIYRIILIQILKFIVVIILEENMFSITFMHFVKNYNKKCVITYAICI